MPNPVIMTPTDDVTGTNPEAGRRRLLPVGAAVRRPAPGRRRPADQLVIVPGQFRDLDSSSNGGGIQRLFTQT